MLYELHVSDVLPGRMTAAIEQFVNAYIELFQRHGIRPVLFFDSLIGAPSNRVTYLIPWNSLEEMDRCWASFRDDPEYQRVEAEVATTEPLFSQSTKTIFREIPAVQAKLRDAG